MKEKYFFIIILIIVAGIMACDSKKENIKGYHFQSIKTITNKDWEKLSQLKIFFGHQSVGFNIMEGVNDILNEMKPNILTINTSLNSLKTGTKSLFVHTKVGRNTEPLVKIDDFSKKIQEINGNVDIAFVKLCYVDITEGEDINKIFNHYKSTISALKEMYPEIIFIHFTVPLTVNEKGVKTFIKKVLGKKLSGFKDNVVRMHYNELVRGEFEGKEPLFDLAMIESTDLKGKQTLYFLDKQHYTTLVEDYTFDGGHLNERGRRIVAEQLLLYIINLV